MQRHLFSDEGQARIAALLRAPALLAFDFDGTLAPIVQRPEDARVPPAVAQALQQLSARLPVAVVSGRAVADLGGRLGFAPRYVLGNHGAEGWDWPDADAHRAALDGLRATLARRGADIAAAGIAVEDKGASLALHYRQASEPAAATALLQSLLQPPAPEWLAYGGKMVVNVVPAAAPDKARAVQALLADCGAASAFFVGDDVNDEPVFAAAPPHWLTVRVGRDDPASKAMFVLDSSDDMAALLERLRAALLAAR